MKHIDIEGYKKTLDSTLDESREMRDLLKAKIRLIQESQSGITFELTKVQNNIDIIKTNGELKVLERIIDDKEKYFKQWFPIFEKDATDCNGNWDFVLNLAKQERNKVEIIGNILKSMEANESRLDDPEVKVGYYKTLKKQLNA